MLYEVIKEIDTSNNAMYTTATFKNDEPSWNKREVEIKSNREKECECVHVSMYIIYYTIYTLYNQPVRQALPIGYLISEWFGQ